MKLYKYYIQLKINIFYNIVNNIKILLRIIFDYFSIFSLCARSNPTVRLAPSAFPNRKKQRMKNAIFSLTVEKIVLIDSSCGNLNIITHLEK